MTQTIFEVLVLALITVLNSKLVKFLTRNVWYFLFGGFAIAEILTLLYLASK